MIDFLTLSAAFGIGLLGAGHCLGMCGGLVAALSFALPAGSVVRKAVYLVAYSIGRIFSYSAIGLLAGFLGVALFSQTSFPFARVTAGILLVLLGLYLANWWRALRFLELGGSKIWRFIRPIADRFVPVKNVRQALALGFLWGWLPCGLVYSALGYAFASAETSPFQGALIMCAFGLGTLPAVIGGGFASKLLLDFFKLQKIRIFLAVCYMVFGATTLYFALAHMGHSQHGDHADHHNHDIHVNPKRPGVDHSKMDHSTMHHSTMHHSEVDHTAMGQESRKALIEESKNKGIENK